ncbi:hypothetical protein RS030_192875 [Cryptosporidium xiaoi]|uniref:Peptidase S9 prolyl oligopeptidase catalytic domain-containing protein n=1 Tax=Cryptosporidium xiaoi TaxID=659607 RepID=A0AAV9Y160_9CRYT
MNGSSRMFGDSEGDKICMNNDSKDKTRNTVEDEQNGKSISSEKELRGNGVGSNIGEGNINNVPSKPIIAALCCLTTMGLRSKIVSSFSFFPPKISGLVLKELDGNELVFKREFINRKFGIEYITLRSITNIEKRLVDLLVSDIKVNIYSTWIESGKSKIPISCVVLSPIMGKTLLDLSNKQVPLFIYSHGNASDIGNMLPVFINMSLKLNVHVIAYDYRSYGLSLGKPTERGMYADIKAVYNYAVNVLKIPTNKIFLLGQSIGSAPTIYLAKKLGKNIKSRDKSALIDSNNCSENNALPLGGIIVQSGIASGLNALLSPEYNKDIMCDVFLNYKNIRKIPFPMLILHGTSDQVIHISNSHKLFENAKKNKYHPPITTWWVEGASHDIPGSNNTKKEYYQKLSSFINSVTH